MVISVVCTLFALLVLGFVSGTLSGVRAIKSGIRAVIVGGLAIALGIFVGSFAEANFL